ncbi:MAG: hypothetical protein MJY82_11165 [Fibrobacter sp.]|nr:hypothetical protein [Fibrobacter sp.]
MDFLKINFKFTFCLGIAAITMLFSGCSISGNYKHIEKISTDVPAAPEVRGASTYQEPNTAKWRTSLGVRVGQTQQEKIHGITNSLGSCKNIEHCKEDAQILVKRDVDATYNIKYPVVFGGFDRLRKYDIILWSFGASLDNGTNAFVTLGVNTEHFEIGASLGAWIFFNNYEYSGTSYYCTQYPWNEDYSLGHGEFSESSSIDLALVYGGYASAYLGPFSLNYSISIYRPPHSESGRDESTTVQANFELPMAFTEYITAGYRLNKHWEFRAGAINVFGDFNGMHWAGIGGVSYYFN